MSYPNVYLIRIYDRQWGFRVVAVVSQDADEAKEFCERKYSAQFRDSHKSCFGKIEDSCGIEKIENHATFTFRE